MHSNLSQWIVIQHLNLKPKFLIFCTILLLDIFHILILNFWSRLSDLRPKLGCWVWPPHLVLWNFQFFPKSHANQPQNFINFPQSQPDWTPQKILLTQQSSWNNIAMLSELLHFPSQQSHFHSYWSKRQGSIYPPITFFFFLMHNDPIQLSHYCCWCLFSDGVSLFCQIIVVVDTGCTCCWWWIWDIWRKNICSHTPHSDGFFVLLYLVDRIFGVAVAESKDYPGWDQWAQEASEAYPSQPRRETSGSRTITCWTKNSATHWGSLAFDAIVSL